MEKDVKEARYRRLALQVKELFEKTRDPIARMASLNAVLFHKIDYFFWCGFYRLIDGELTVGPYQGSLACLILKKNTGVCWAAANQQRTIIVPDIHQFPDHIACDSRSRSEMVVPLFSSPGCVSDVFDVDSRELNTFDEIDRAWLEKFTSWIYSGTNL